MADIATAFISSLSRLNASQLPDDQELCPICLVPFDDIYNEKPTLEQSLVGVTRLEACGHIFCMKDLVEWVRGMHGNCPTCRNKFLDIRPPSDSDDESSDGGEYLPNADEDEDESLYNFDMNTDPITDVDLETRSISEMNTEPDWDPDVDVDIETEGDSSIIDTDEDLGLEDVDDGISVSIHEDEEFEEGIIEAELGETEAK